MAPELIKASLKMRGYSMSDIARYHKVTPQTVRKTVFSEGKSRTVATTVAAILGKSLDELWPGEYPERYKRADPYAAMRKQIEIATKLQTRKAA